MRADVSLTIHGRYADEMGDGLRSWGGGAGAKRKAIAPADARGAAAQAQQKVRGNFGIGSRVRYMRAGANQGYNGTIVDAKCGYWSVAGLRTRAPCTAPA